MLGNIHPLEAHQPKQRVNWSYLCLIQPKCAARLIRPGNKLKLGGNASQAGQTAGTAHRTRPRYSNLKIDGADQNRALDAGDG
jgi:hypothetical protein